MSESICHALKKRLFDPRCCGDPASLIKLLGMHVGKPLTAPDDLQTLDERQAKSALDFLERWFPDRSSSLIDSICANAQVV